MKSSLALVIISKNAAELLDACLGSAQRLADEIVLVDDYSSDKTLEIAKKYSCRIYKRHERDLGKQKAYGITKVKGKWVLILDADEIISRELKEEIKKKLEIRNLKLGISAYKIPFQNHFLGKAIRYGGENYAMVRLFRKKYGISHPSLVHEKIEIRKGQVGKLRNKILHYSYRSLGQMYGKFTDYALREAEQKMKKGEKSSLKKIFLYPIHMFWARFVEDRGYKDGLFRIPLDLGFAYMEWLTYVVLLISNLKTQMSKPNVKT